MQVVKTPTNGYECSRELTAKEVGIAAKFITDFIVETLGPQLDPIGCREFFQGRVVEELSSEGFMSRGFSFSRKDLMQKEGWQDFFFQHVWNDFNLSNLPLEYYAKTTQLEGGDLLFSYGQVIAGSIHKEETTTLRLMKEEFINEIV